MVCMLPDVGDVASNWVNKYSMLFPSCTLISVVYYLLCLVFVITCPGHCIRHSLCPGHRTRHLTPTCQNFKTDTSIVVFLQLVKSLYRSE